MEDESDVDSVVSWNSATPAALSVTSDSPNSVVQWTPPIGSHQDMSSDGSVVPWNAIGSPATALSPILNHSAMQTPTRNQKIGLPLKLMEEKKTPAIKRKIFPSVMDIGETKKGI